MARWIAYSLLLFLGILALAATVIQNVDGVDTNGDENKDDGSVDRITARRPGGTSNSNTRTTSGKRRKKNRKKHKKKHHYDHSDKSPSSASSSKPARTPYQGTGGLGSTTWVAAFKAGRVFKGKSYFNTSRYAENPNKMPTICENRNLTEYDESDNETNTILFICPGENDTDNLDHCCGAEGFEHCCAYESPDTVLILGILSALVAVAVIIFGCCVWKKIHQKSELDMDKQPADQVVTANLNDPMLPPSIITSPPPPSPPQPTTGSQDEHLELPPIDGNDGGYPQADKVPSSQTDEHPPSGSPTKDHLVIKSGETLPSQPPPQAV